MPDIIVLLILLNENNPGSFVYGDLYISFTKFTKATNVYRQVA